MKRFTVGETFEWVREVDPYRPVYYAGASGDYNPIHIDQVVGRAAGYQGVILQGMCTFSWLSDACVSYLGDPTRLRRLRARFTKPVQVGDVIRFQGRCAAADGRSLRLEVAASNQAGEEVLKGAVAEANAQPLPPGERTGGGTRERAPEPSGSASRHSRLGNHLGRRYGPYRFEVGRESVLDFIAATDEGVPGRVFCTSGSSGSPRGVVAEASPSDEPPPLVAPPAYAAVFAMQPFATACADPGLALNVLRLVHGEQSFEFLEPVRPGDVLYTSGEITRLQDRGNLDFLEVTSETVDRRGRPVVRGVWTAIVRN